VKSAVRAGDDTTDGDAVKIKSKIKAGPNCPDGCIPVEPAS
jgi:hypothetical protein